jgi:hypothetical protein
MGRLTRLIDEFPFTTVADVVATMGPLPTHTLA